MRILPDQNWYINYPKKQSSPLILSPNQLLPKTVLIKRTYLFTKIQPKITFIYWAILPILHNILSLTNHLSKKVLHHSYNSAASSQISELDRGTCWLRCDTVVGVRTHILLVSYVYSCSCVVLNFSRSPNLLGRTVSEVFVRIL